MNIDACPCGLDRPWTACCGRYVDGDETPDTAEALMRSRYSAYSRGAVGYLHDTSSAPVRATFDRRSAQAWADAATFNGLEIFETIAGGPDDDEGVVDFTASWLEGGRQRALRERSRFVREGGAWRYDGGTKGAPPVVRAEPKIGRNDPCPCGSGKKFKRCCGR